MEIWKGSMLVNIEGEYSATGEDMITVQPRAKILFAVGRAYSTVREGEERYLLSNAEGAENLAGQLRAWVLGGDEGAVEMRTQGEFTLRSGERGITVEAERACTLFRHPSRPRCDLDGNRYKFSILHGEELEETLAHLYWDTMVPSIVERTRAGGYPVRDGYVISTLDPNKYAGTYPDVDHEFQCKGRLAFGDSFDSGVVRRMMGLQLRMMREDPMGLWRNPCAVQPGGEREYHVRRGSMDGSANAEMFLVTGNAEILETAWLYVSRSGDIDWLKAHIVELQGAASLLEHLTDEGGRLWSDVFYEDQVIKDGIECMSACMAANAFRCLALLEEELHREEYVERYREMERRLGEALVRPAPDGFWDVENSRFIDWIDRNGEKHDHIHLLANILPVLMGYASKEQSAAVGRLVAENLEEFQRFPTFLSAHIEDYTDAEIGDGGPYDLCAAGRYWCWDAAYWAHVGDRERILRQLLAVSEQAKADGYLMGERYDMNHVYYKDERNWHGAAWYYEYPCVFSWVLLCEYLGFGFMQGEKLYITPRLASFGSVFAESFGVAFQYGEGEFVLENLGDKSKRACLNLGFLYQKGCECVVVDSMERFPVEDAMMVTLPPKQKLRIEIKNGK